MHINCKKPQIVNAPGAPKAAGPYSQAVKANGFVFVSGQLPIEPSTGAIPSGEIEIQTTQVIKNTEKILAACGLTLADVVKTDVFLKDLADFDTMNGVYEKMFSGHMKPARSVVQAARLPKDVKIELSSIACCKGQD
ncbi:MAG: Rid family detoxifying hydrolase [Candidatus Omnitrophica bacterium]|nr:Rid family detoxifying hydrolase [Candidatus Omnitrophota bacterium]MDD4013629.1 Rid family detoxifying hydrolase [Candidatus Omnitrophota bacterium]